MRFLPRRGDAAAPPAESPIEPGGGAAIETPPSTEGTSVGRNVGGTITATLAVQVSLLISGVAAARILGVEDRGHFALLLMFANLIPLVVNLGTPLAVTYRLAQNPAVGLRMQRALVRPVLLQIALTFVVHIAVVLLVFFDEPEGSVHVAGLLSLLAAPPIAIWIYALAVLQGNQEFKALNLSRAAVPPLQAAILAALLAADAGDLVVVTSVWVGLMWTAAALTGSLAHKSVVRNAREAPDGEVPSVREMSAFGAKSWFGSVTPLEGFQLDQLLVGLIISTQELGAYVVAVAFTNFPRFVGLSIGLVAYPAIAATKTHAERVRSTLKFVSLTVVLCGAIVAVIEVALPWVIPFLFTDEFRPAIGIGRILLISTLLFAVRRVLNECARGSGRPILSSIAEAASLAAFFPAVLFLGADDGKEVATALIVCGAVGVAVVVGGLLVPAERLARLRARRDADQVDEGLR